MKSNILLLAALLSAPVFTNAGDYTVVKDDNLWNLSGEYLGDPTEWQRIWSANQYIQNPDLIYPGDNISIPGLKNENDDTPLQVKQDAPVTFNDKLGSLSGGTQAKVTNQPAETAKPAVQMDPLRAYFRDRSDLYSRATRRAAPYILSENETSNIELIPGVGEIKDESRQMYGLNTIVTVVADSGQTLTVGEQYDFSHSVKLMTHRERSVNVIRPVGSGVVLSTFSDSARIRITEAWDKIGNGARIEPYRHYTQLREPRIQKDIAPANAKLLTRIEDGVMIKPYEIIILDSGEDAGIKPGDLFEGIYVDKEGKAEHEPCFRGIIVTIDDNSSALIVQEVYKRIGDGNYDLSRYGRLIFK